tara:strand:+ start:111 stop:329 length:219 start_codon:yes stop_codon:yes gene_type:complete
MKSIVLLLLVIGIVMISTGYQKSLYQNMENLKTVVEYRFIPRSIYEEQIQPINIQQSFKDMFEKEDVYLSRV